MRVGRICGVVAHEVRRGINDLQGTGLIACFLQLYSKLFIHVPLFSKQCKFVSAKYSDALKLGR